MVCQRGVKCRGVFDVQDWSFRVGFSTGDTLPSVLAPVPELSGGDQGQVVTLSPCQGSRASAQGSPSPSCRGWMLQDAEITPAAPRVELFSAHQSGVNLPGLSEPTGGWSGKQQFLQGSSAALGIQECPGGMQ